VNKIKRSLVAAIYYHVKLWSMIGTVMLKVVHFV